MIRLSLAARNLLSWRFLFVLVVALTPCAAWAQFIPGLSNAGAAPGVSLEPDGTLKRRQLDEKSEMTTMRARAKATLEVAKNEKLTCVSLPRAFAAARKAIDAGKPIPDDIKYLGGLTQIKFVFVYEEEKDLMIAGPAEPVHVIDELNAIGTRTGRPVMRLEDFVVAMQVVRGLGGGAFGCRLDPDPAAPGRITDAMTKMARASRADRISAVADATGPQKVSFFGKVPDDTRFALATVAADYELKRYGLGLARSTVAGLGNGVDNSRQAVNMWWFELAYEPLLVSANGDAYGLRGPRLKVQAGSFNWDPKGATATAYDFAKRMSANMEALGTTQPLIADLQNLADLAVVSAIIQRDRLDRKINWDTGWILQTSTGGFPVAKITVPKTAVALANYTNGAIAAGGVVLSPAKVASGAVEKDEKQTMADPKKRATGLRKKNPEAAIVSE